jgi:hypothetical protein
MHLEPVADHGLCVTRPGFPGSRGTYLRASLHHPISFWTSQTFAATGFGTGPST